MNYYYAPEHIAEPHVKKSVDLYVGYIAGALMAYAGLKLIVNDHVFWGIAIWLFLISAVSFEIFGFKYCPACNENKIPISKKYCYTCWERAMKSPDDPSNQAVLNPEN